MTSAWCLVVPVKRLDVAKTRLGALAGDARRDLAVAFAADTVAATLRCPEVRGVVVVTDEPSAARDLEALGAQIVPDAPDAGLNPALRHGAAEGARRWPGCGVAALAADLPALRPAELAAALAAAAAVPEPAAFVADASGTGTTLLAAPDPVAFAPAFGARSRARHRAAGARDLDSGTIGSDVPTLRRDVDTEADLWDARRLGIGPRTAAVVDRLGPAG